MNPYQFAFHKEVSKTPPEEKDFQLVSSGVKLNRDDKDRIFHKIQANSGRAYYKLLGWIFPFADFMNTYLVKYQDNGWQEIKSFDKMCIRNSWYTNSKIIKIIELPSQLK